MQVGKPKKLNCLPKDYRNYVEIVRRLNFDVGDIDCINRMFLRMQQKSSDFFRLIHTDEEGRLIIVFWVHPRNRAAYEEFNDVVTVDFSYIVNRYKMPFVSIVGVNHHGQSILFGLALIYREDKETYK